MKPSIKQKINKWYAETFDNYTCYWSAGEFVTREGLLIYGYRGYQYQGSYRDFIPDYVGRKDRDVKLLVKDCANEGQGKP